MDFEINTGKLEPYMEKKNTEELVSWKNRQFFFSVFQRFMFFICYLFHASFWKVFG